MQYVKMPQPLFVIGGFYALVAACYLCSFLRNGFWRGIWREVMVILTAYPLRSISAIIVALGLILFVDLPLTKLAQHTYNQNFYTVVDFINSTGEGWFVGTVIFTLVLIYQFWGKWQLAMLAKISFMASIYAGLCNTVIKIVINRERPSISMNPDNFFHFIATGCKHWGDLFYASNSMPSGHTITVFAAITPFLYYAKSLTSRVWILSLGGLICFARVYTLNHWLSDVYISSILGMVIGTACYNCNRYRLEMDTE